MNLFNENEKVECSRSSLLLRVNISLEKGWKYKLLRGRGLKKYSVKGTLFINKRETCGPHTLDYCTLKERDLSAPLCCQVTCHQDKDDGGNSPCSGVHIIAALGLFQCWGPLL